LTDERLRFADPDADAEHLLPVPAGLRLPVQMPLHLRLQDTVRQKARRIRDGIAKDIVREEARGTPFFFVPVFLALGAIFYFVAPGEPSLAVLATVPLLLFALWQFRLSGGHNAWLAAALCLMALGGALAKIETIKAKSTMLGGEISTQADLRIRKIEFGEKSLRITADVLATTRPVLKYAPSRIKVTLRNATADLKAGDIISARFGLQPPSGPVRPGGYDFAFHAWFAGVGANGFSMGKITKLPDQPSNWFDRMSFALENTRMAIAQKVRAVLPGTDGAMSAALIAGVSGGIDEDTNEAMRLTGLAHIISISGLHMALVAGVFMVTIRLGFALFPAAASHLPVKKYGAAVALLASLLYLLLSGAGVATLRSFIMLAVMLVAVLFDRQALTLRNLAISAILILIVTPHEIMGPSFQMSFAATAALISAYSFMAERQHEKQTSHQPHSRFARARMVLTGATLTPVVAGIATALFSAWHFHRLSPMGLPANLAAMPVVSLVVMPFAVLSALAMPFGLEHWPLKIMGEGVHLMLAIARYFADLSPAGLSGAISRPAFLMATLALTLLCLLQTRLRLVGLMLLPALVLLFANPPDPEILVSEDARLVAFVGENDVLSVNRQRPNSFTTQTWQRATKSGAILKPKIVSDLKGAGSLYHLAAANIGIFICQSGLCVLDDGKGGKIAWVEQVPENQKADSITGTRQVTQVSQPALRSDDQIYQIGGSPTDRKDGPIQTGVINRNEVRFSPQFLKNLRQACTTAVLVISATPTPFQKCPIGKARLLRASELAKKGTAEINITNENNELVSLADSDSQPWAMFGEPIDVVKASENRQDVSVRKGKISDINIRFAVGEPERPWNRERIYSRAARNMPEFQPIRRAAPPKSEPSATKSAGTKPMQSDNIQYLRISPTRRP
jgi:ComEC/Rec2-related protein